MPLSNALATRLFTDTFGSGTPASLSFRLFTSMPNPRTGSGGVVVSAGGYSNATVANNTANFPAPITLPGAIGVIQRVAPVVGFGTPTVAWSNIVGLGIYAGTDLWYAAEFDTPLSFAVGRAVQFEADSIEITFDPAD